MTKTFLFQLDHPAHYHLFINTIRILRDREHVVYISIKRKDILEKLLEGEDFFIISENYRDKNIASILKSLFQRDFRLFKLVKKLNPDVMIGTSPEIGHIRKLVPSKAIFFGEDDVTLSFMMYLAAISCYPFYDAIVTPDGCNNSIWKKKTAFYNGFQKLAYLHPSYFKPDRTKVDVPETEHFFILRLAKLAAYHDIKNKGITDEIAGKIIQILEPHGKILITSEREIPNEFEKYRFMGTLNDIHHCLYYASIYIGDSQSMAVEAAMLGTPGIRYNNFAGKISVLEDLEHKYGLTYAIKPDEPEKLYKKIREYLNMPGLKEEFQIRRKKMLDDKIDVTSFMVWFIENYPESHQIMIADPGYADRFK